ncbi:MAG: DUF4040 domain-containing protein [Lachnospiraceae bacterium]|nr:DUF4040 domain-containing protein [Lachnospiraceae bacterium]
MKIFMIILFAVLIICAIIVTVTKNLLNSILVYMAFSLIMSIIWICLQSPDLAITEAAVGAGVTTVLFIATLKKIHAIQDDRREDENFDTEHEPELGDVQEEDTYEGK